MPGDTKIRKTPQGWIDVDVPTSYWKCRRLARDARRGYAVPNYPKKGRSKIASMTSQVTPHYTPVNIPDGTPMSKFDPRPLSSLQLRLYDRLTQRQGVTAADAYDVITSYGYNAAASYGHIREAGANHSEAIIVIDLGSPAASLAYGKRRANGYNHTWALARALVAAQMDDDADDD